MFRPLIAPLILALSSTVAFGQAEAPKPLRAGIIGLDTSHVVAFTKALNAESPKPGLEGVRVVAAYPGGSPDVESSRTRIEGFTRQLRDEFHVEIVDSIEALLEKVDVVLLESVDGRPHLKQVEPVLKARKPVFVDKPVAGSLADAIKIFKLAEQYKTPCFSSSSLRYTPSIQALRGDPKFGEVEGCATSGPSPTEEHHPDLFWYGIHGVETLFTVMGTGCLSVTRVSTDGTDLVAGIWEGGRIGTFRGIRKGKAEYTALAFGSKDVVFARGAGGYEPLLVEVCQFFRTGQAPVSASETIEIFAFMEAADESKRRGGTPVTLDSVIAAAGGDASR
ncbi:Gfo/Idh/MocA family protein [Tundrisphaera lichenicola]|uniref:Gfo/Idh/MocA family protein n=1 Tax=Tundrisphaera lichenicola TaxID=2029860 RepID=UPI003EBFDCCE